MHASSVPAEITAKQQHDNELHQRPQEEEPTQAQVHFKQPFLEPRQTPPMALGSCTTEAGLQW
eukprot:10766664-Prorocentrum_lima.AAC.1